MSDRSLAAVAPTPAKPVVPPPALASTMVVEEPVAENALGDFTKLRPRTSISANIGDDDEARALVTRFLLQELAPLLGLDPDKIEIRVNTEAESRVNAHGATGLMDDGRVYLHPVRYQPSTPTGRALLAHELTHAAQRTIPSENRRNDAEREAALNATAIERGAVITRPRIGLETYAIAADTGATTQQDVDQAVVDSRHEELTEIARLLGGLWISDGDVENVFQILRSLQMPAARALLRQLTRKELVELVDNINKPHYIPYRAQVFLCYSELRPKEIQSDFDEDLLVDMGIRNLTNLSFEEAMGAANISKNLKPKDREDLNKSDVGKVVREIEKIVDDPNAKREWQEGEDKRLEAALKEEKQLKDERQAAQALRAKDEKKYGAIDAAVRKIKKILNSFIVTDKDARNAVDLLQPFERDDAAMRAAAQMLVEEDEPLFVQNDGALQERYREKKDYLDELIDQFPVPDLYEQGSVRRRVFLRLLLFRPGYKNAAFARKLTPTGFLSRVNSDDAYLAFQLVKALPPAAREAFMASEHWGVVQSEMSVSQKEGETTNFYLGGKNQEDRDNILTQVMDDAVWADFSRLKGVIRMAVAAGNYPFVFEESKRRYERIMNPQKGEAPKTPYGNAELAKILDSFKLYNPASGRAEPDKQLLKPNGWWHEGVAGFFNEKVIQGLDFVFSSEDVEVGTKSLGGKGLNLAEFQDITGGSFMGVRFKTLDEVDKETLDVRKKDSKDGEPSMGAGEFARRTHTGVNFADVKWDRNTGVMEVEVSYLEIAAINYPLGDLKIQTGSTNMRGISVNMRYPTEDTPSQVNVIDVKLRSVEVNDLLLIKPDSIKSINQVKLNGFRILVRPSGTDHTKLKGPRDGLLYAGIGGTFANILSASSSGAELGQNLLVPSAAMEMEIHFDSLELSGISTSGGQYVASVTIHDFHVGGGGDVVAYTRALNKSIEGLKTRLNAESAELANAKSDKDKTAHEAAIRQLQKQLNRAETEKTQVAENDKKVKELEAKEKEHPADFTEEDRVNLKKLRASLKGAVMDVGSIDIKGVAGAPVPDLNLKNIHGQGSSISGLLGMMGEPNTFGKFIEGKKTVQGLDKTDANFVIDIGHVELPDIRLTGKLPTEDQAREDYQKFLNRSDWRQANYETRREELEKRVQNAKRYAELKAIGVENLDKDGRAEFMSVRKALEAFETENALRIQSVTLEGTELSLGDDGKLGVKADQLDAKKIFNPKTGMTVESVHGEKIEASAKMKGGLFGLDEWRKNLKSGGLKADLLQVEGFVDPDSGLGAKKATIRGLDASAQFGKDTSADLVAKSIELEGVTWVWTERILLLQEERLSRQDPKKLTAAQKTQLKNVRDILAGIAHNKEILTEVEVILRDEKATDAKKTDAQKRKDLALDMLEYYNQQASIKKLTVTDLNVGISGLGDVLAEDYKFDDAKKKGISVQGKGGEGKDQILSGATVEGAWTRAALNDEGSIDQLKVGPVKGGLTYGDDFIEFHNFQIEQTDISDFAFLSPASSISGSGTSTIGKLSVSGRIDRPLVDPMEPEGDRYVSHIRLDQFHIDYIDCHKVLYWRNKDNLRVELKSGTLRKIDVEGIDVTLPKMEGDALKVAPTKDGKGHASLGALEQARVAVTTGTGMALNATANAKTLEAQVAEDGSVQVDLTSLGIGGAIHQKDLDAKFNAKAKGLHLTLLPGSKGLLDSTQKFRVEDVEGDVSGTKGKHKFGAEFSKIGTTAEIVRYPDGTIVIPGLVVPSLKIKYLHVDTASFLLDVPAGQDIEMAGINIAVKLEPHKGAENEDTFAFDRILIQKFEVPIVAVKGMEAVLKKKGITITLPKDVWGSLKGLALTADSAHPEGFEIKPNENWNMIGKFGMKSFDLSKLSADLPGAFIQSADVAGEGFSIGFLGAGKTEVDLDKATAENIEGSLSGSPFFVKLSKTRYGKAGVGVKGFHYDEKGARVKEASIEGFRYEDPSKGLVIDLRSATLPEREDGKSAFEMAEDGSVLIPNLKIKDAYFKIDDVLKLGGGPPSKGPSFKPKPDFLDQTNGHINFDVHATGSDSTAGTAIDWLDSEYNFRLDITNGQFNYGRINSAFGLGQAVVGAHYEPPMFDHMVPARFRIYLGGPEFNWVLNRAEEPLAENGMIRIAALVRQTPTSPIEINPEAPSRTITELQYYNVDVLLTMPGGSKIELGEQGYILLGGGPADVPAFQFTALSRTANARGSQLLLNLSANVSDVDLNIDAGGTKLKTGPIHIETVQDDTTLSFAPIPVGANTFDAPRTMEGTIGSATATNIRLIPPPKSEGTK